MDGGEDKATRPTLADRTVDLFGKPWTLRFSNRALYALRDAWGYQSDGLVVLRITRMNPSDLAFIFYGLTRSHHMREISLEGCLDLFDDPRKFEDWKETADLFAEICGAALPEPQKKKKATENPPAPAGKKSAKPQ